MKRLVLFFLLACLPALAQINNGGGGAGSGTVSANNTANAKATARYNAAGGSTTIEPGAGNDDGTTFDYQGTGGLKFRNTLTCTTDGTTECPAKMGGSNASVPSGNSNGESHWIVAADGSLHLWINGADFGSSVQFLTSIAGTGDAITSSAPINAYPVAAPWPTYCWLPGANNTSTTPTININAKGAKTIVKMGGSALAANDIVSGHISCVDYNGTTMDLKNPATASGLADPGGNGIVVRTGVNATTNRSIASGSPSITVSNADGTAGNPTVTATPTLDEQSTTDLTLDGSEDQVFLTSLPAAAVASGRCIDIDITLGRAGGTGGVVLKLYFGATPSLVATYTSSSSSSAMWLSSPPIRICNNPGSTTAQTIIVPSMLNAGGTLAVTGGIVATSAETTTNALTVKMTATGTNLDKVHRYLWRVMQVP